MRPLGTWGAFCLLTDIPHIWSLSRVAFLGGGGGESSSLRSTTSTFTLLLGFSVVSFLDGDGVEDGVFTGGVELIELGGAAGLGGATGLGPTPGLTIPGGLGPLGLIPLGGTPLGPPGLTPLGPGAPALIGILGLIVGLI